MRRSEAGANLKATVPRSSVPWARRPLSAPGLTTLTLVADGTSSHDSTRSRLASALPQRSCTVVVRCSP